MEIKSNSNCTTTDVSEMSPLEKIQYFADQILDTALNNIPEDNEETHALLNSMHQELMDGLNEHIQNLDELNQAILERFESIEERFGEVRNCIFQRKQCNSSNSKNNLSNF